MGVEGPHYMGDTEVDPATMTPYRDGPYIVRGQFAVVEQNGREVLVGRRWRAGDGFMCPYHRS